MIPIAISSTGINPKSPSQSPKSQLASQYMYTTVRICNTWHIFNCKKLSKLKISLSRLILLIAKSRDRWIFSSYSWEVKNSIIILIIIIIIIIIYNYVMQIRIKNITKSMQTHISDITISPTIFFNFPSIFKLNQFCWTKWNLGS